MKVFISEEAGFCFGVKRALELINQLHENGENIQIFGQLIHNKTVLNDLKSMGIECIHSVEDLDPQKKIIIRTHGIPLETESELKKKFDYVDATCPFVKRNHKILKKLNQKKSKIVIIGDKSHPEIIAAKSYSKDSIVVNSEREAKNISGKDTISVVAQTTLNTDFLKRIVSILIEKAKKIEVYNTICHATKVRQEAIKKLASNVDFVIVVGGKNSSNTKKLYEISLKKNQNTFHIEKSSDLYSSDLIDKIKKIHTVGITAGASTPMKEIEKINKILNKIDTEKEKKNGKTKRNLEY